MAHLAKYTRAVMGHMLSHYDRSKNNISNDNINSERSNLNYNLALHQQSSQIDFIRQRLSEVKVQNRKDVNIFCDWVLTAPKELPKSDEEKFFKESYNFFEKRYGKDNVISAYVHLDEVSPHMHFAFVPVVPDKKKGGYKLSAKECITRKDLQTFHQDLNNHLQHVFNRDIGILNEATKEGNRSIQELKRQSATEKLKEVEEKALKIVADIKIEAQLLKDSLTPLKSEYEAKKAYLNELDRTSNISVMFPEYAKIKKNLLGKETVTVPIEKWEERHISANEKQYIKKAQAKFEETMKSVSTVLSAKHLKQLNEVNKQFKKENQSLKQENYNLKQTIASAEQETERVIDKINRVLNNLPEEVAEQFVQMWKSSDWEQKKNKFYEMEER